MSSSWTTDIGDGSALSAAPLLIASLTSSPVLVAGGLLMQYLPWLLFGLLAGSIADHHDRRRLVMIADGSRAIVVLGLVAFLVAGQVTVWIALGMAFPARDCMRRHERGCDDQHDPVPLVRR